MKTWWLQLSLAEKRTCVLGALMSSLLLIYCFIWLPLNQKIIASRTTLAANQALLIWMQAADLKLKHSHQSSVLTPKITFLPSLIQNSLNNTAIVANLNQFHPTDSDTVQLSFKQVAFDALISWLLELTKQGIEVTQMTAKTVNHSGSIETEFTLKKSN